ncbi:hypothetical protein HK098_002099 [Nowakowskiella sp. JEL0407]|nr:hypothetical protein HK098_002099 [Nowakowskiella sp. JEL0407]
MNSSSPSFSGHNSSYDTSASEDYYDYASKPKSGTLSKLGSFMKKKTPSRSQSYRDDDFRRRDRDEFESRYHNGPRNYHKERRYDEDDEDDHYNGPKSAPIRSQQQDLMTGGFLDDFKQKSSYPALKPAEMSRNMNKSAPNSAYSNNEHFTVIALFDFDGEIDSDLPFRKNDVISVIKSKSREAAAGGSDEAEWWTGRLLGKVGKFPSNYVRVLE